MVESNSTPVRAAAYYRMSTTRQEDSIERQQSQVRPHAAQQDRHGKPRYVLVQEYADRAVAGDVFDRRPDFQRLLRDAKAGLFDVIIVDEWSRLSRQEPVDFIASVVKPLKDAGVTLDTVSEGPQKWDNLAELILMTVRSDKASGESKKLSYRVLAGMAKFAAAGRILGPAPYGYKTRYETVEEPGKPPRVVPAGLDTDPATAHVVRWIFEKYAEGGWTLDALCRELAARNAPPPARKSGRVPRGGKAPPRWGRGAVRVILRNPKYLGIMTWNRRARGKYHALEGGKVRKKDRQTDRPNGTGAWSVVAGTHEALVTQEAFDAVQARLRDHARGGRGPNLGSYLFSCLGVCEHCGRGLKGITTKGRRYYRCHAFDDAGVRVCHHNAVREDALLEVLLATLEETFLDPARQEKLLAKARAKLERERSPKALDPLRRELADLEAKIAHGNGNLLLLPPDRVAAAVETLKGWERDRDRLRAELADRERGAPVADLEETFQGVKEWLWKLRDLAGQLDNPGVLPLLRDTILAGLCRVTVRWERRPFGTRTRHLPVGGTLYLWGAEGNTRQLPVFFTASRSLAIPGGTRCRRWRARASASSPPTSAAITAPPSRLASARTASRRWWPTYSAWSARRGPARRWWSATTGAACWPGTWPPGTPKPWTGSSSSTPRTPPPTCTSCAGRRSCDARGTSSSSSYRCCPKCCCAPATSPWWGACSDDSRRTRRRSRKRTCGSTSGPWRRRGR
jgi:DNA invertase Pin-like site-specific DNA recombinase